MQFIRPDPVHLYCLPIGLHSFRRKHSKKKGVNKEVSPQVLISMLNNRAALEQFHLVPLQTSLLTDLCECLLLRRHTRLYKSAHARPFSTITPYTLASAHDEDARLLTHICALQNTGNDVCWSQQW